MKCCRLVYKKRYILGSKNADKIFYLKNGQIVEEGTHEALLKLDGHYKKMYTKQILEQELEQI